MSETELYLIFRYGRMNGAGWATFVFGKRNGLRTCLVQTFGRAGTNLGRDGLPSFRAISGRLKFTVHIMSSITNLSLQVRHSGAMAVVMGCLALETQSPIISTRP